MKEKSDRKYTTGFSTTVYWRDAAYGSDFGSCTVQYFYLEVPEINSNLSGKETCPLGLSYKQVLLERTICWDVLPCTLVVYQRFTELVDLEVAL
jgi:hypothetical protein